MSFQLPPLPYASDALHPHISAKTLETHHGKHHQAYVTNLNKMVSGKPEEKMTVEDLVKNATGAIFNQAAQVWNHTFYWQSMRPGGGGEPTGAIKEHINQDFGSFQAFKEQFSALAAGHFGSGWAWLLYKPETQKLVLHQTHDAGNPLNDKAGIPILTCDVWEHAYYLDYANRRPEYIAAWWNVINWDFANENLKNAVSS